MPLQVTCLPRIHRGGAAQFQLAGPALLTFVLTVFIVEQIRPAVRLRRLNPVQPRGSFVMVAPAITFFCHGCANHHKANHHKARTLVPRGAFKGSPVP
jgi:hypothetical protein